MYTDEPKFEDINKKLSELCDAKQEKVVNREYRVNGLSLIKLRDILIKIGKIHKESLEESYYFATIPGGFLKKNEAYLLISLNKENMLIACYSHEGLIKQNTCEDAINDFEREIGKYICN